jgi:methyl-accepting chemotaxis protein
MEQISQALASINAAGTQSASGTRQVEDEVRRLRELAEGLERLVDRDRGQEGAARRPDAALV